MRKYISLLLAGLLLMALATGAAASSAAPTATKVYEVKNAEFLGDTDLVVFSTEAFGMDGIMAPDGTVAVSNEYLGLDSRNTYGYVMAIKVNELNGLGLIDTKGQVLVPLEYGDIKLLSREWVMATKLKESTAEHYDMRSLLGGFGSGYYLVEERVFYNMNKGEAVGSLPREAFDKANVYPGFIIITDMAGAITVYDDAFQAIGTVDTSYYGYVFEKNGDSWDIKRAGDGQLLLTSPYEVTQYEASDGTFTIRKDGKMGRMDMAGTVLIPPEYERLYSFDGDYVRAMREQGGKMGLLNRQGEVVVDFKYDDLPPSYLRGISDGPSTRLAVNGYAPVELDGKVGFVSLKGEETVAPSYLKTAVDVSANVLIITDATGKTSLVAADGVVTELPYAKASRLYNAVNGRLVLVADEKGQVGVVDWHGNVVIPVGPYADYGNYTSTNGSMLLMNNKDSRMAELYTITWPE